MTQQTIIGVDFSAAKSRNSTWITDAVLQDCTLTIKRCGRPSTNGTKALEALEKRLFELPPTAVAALDFPFSVPWEFGFQLAPNASMMPDVWKAVAQDIGDYDRYKELRDAFVQFHGERIRRGDANFGGPFSPLKSVNPDMRPMTFHGMKLLHRLWTSDKGFLVPPLRHEGDHKGPTLIETMPGVVLRSFGLRATGYKGNNDHKERMEILAGLTRELKQHVQLSLQLRGEEKKQCIDNADCLDSLVAATSAAMWAINHLSLLSPRESIPPDEEFKRAQLEGWLYAPKPAQY
jgi:hypothetical protein